MAAGERGRALADYEGRAAERGLGELVGRQSGRGRSRICGKSCIVRAIKLRAGILAEDLNPILKA